MSGARRHVRGRVLGVAGVLCALAWPAGAADISRAREVAPPPGDHGELLYELPIAPAAPLKGPAPQPAASAAASVKTLPRREARDAIPNTNPNPTPGGTASRPALKPSTPVSAPIRRTETAAATAPVRAARPDRAPETTPRSGEGQVRSAVRAGRAADVPRETPSVAGQGGKVKQAAAAPVRGAMKREKTEKSRHATKAPA